MQKSYRAPNPGDKRQWFLIDAKDQPLGRLAVVIANKLRAKDLPTFDPSVDAGAFVIVTNAALVKITGKTEEQKLPEPQPVSDPSVEANASDPDAGTEVGQVSLDDI